MNPCPFCGAPHSKEDFGGNSGWLCRTIQFPGVQPCRGWCCLEIERLRAPHPDTARLDVDTVARIKNLLGMIVSRKQYDSSWLRPKHLTQEEIEHYGLDIIALLDRAMDAEKEEARP